MKSFAKLVSNLLRRTWKICFKLFSVMIPVVIIVKVLQELGLIEGLGRLLEPIMRIVGLPGSMGLAWATTLVTNLYGGISSYLALSQSSPLTVGQVTVLSSMMLIAHALPVEIGIASKAGARWPIMTALRIGGAILYGVILNWALNATGRFDAPATALIAPVSEANGLWGWVWGQCLGLGKIFLMVLGLVILLGILNKLKVTDVIERCLQPILAPVGIGKEAANVTTIGMVLGLSYGGGLILEEVEKGHVKPKDVFLSLALMGLCHSVIEDTLLMAALGGTLWGLLAGRIVFTFIVMVVIGLIVRRLGPKVLNRVCFVQGETTDKEGDVPC